MATLKSVIDYVDEIKPNAFSNEAKTKWLNECEGLVQTEVLLWASEEIITYQYDADKDKELLAQPPHDKIYWAYRPVYRRKSGACAVQPEPEARDERDCRHDGGGQLDGGRDG